MQHPKSEIPKIIQGAETRFWALNGASVSVLWAFSFSLSIYFLSFCPSVCVSADPLLFHTTAQTAAWPEMKGTGIAGPGAMSELAERQNVLPKCSHGHWPGPGTMACLSLKCLCQNWAGKHLTSPHTSTAELVCRNWEFYHPLQFTDSAHTASRGNQSTCQDVLLVQSRCVQRQNFTDWKIMCHVLIVYQVLPSFCFYSNLAEVPPTKKVWKCMRKNSSLLSQHHAHCCQFLWFDWTAQGSKKRRPNLQSCYFYIL